MHKRRRICVVIALVGVLCIFGNTHWSIYLEEDYRSRMSDKIVNSHFIDSVKRRVQYFSNSDIKRPGDDTANHISNNDARNSPPWNEHTALIKTSNVLHKHISSRAGRFKKKAKLKVSSHKKGKHTSDIKLAHVLQNYQTMDDGVSTFMTFDNLTSYVSHIWKEASDCHGVLSRPRMSWKCENYSSLQTSEGDFVRMRHIVQCGGPLDLAYINALPRPQGLYLFEKLLLTLPPLKDSMLATNESRSTMRVLNNTDHLILGDTIVLRIDAKDGYGEQKLTGGDVIRAWITDSDQGSAVAMRVRDLHNGTYLATSRLMWAGVAVVKVALGYPREYLRALAHLHLVKKSLKLSAGAFKNSDADEATPCSHLPIIPGHESHEVCNLTEINGSPWFCGRPTKSQLDCTNFYGTRNLPMSGEDRKFLPVTTAEFLSLQRSNVHPRIRYIGDQIDITVQPNSLNEQMLAPPDIPCHQVLPSATWNLGVPTGLFHKGVWFPSTCTRAPPSRECLRNTRVISLGDSNIRASHQYLCKHTGSQHVQRQLWKAWHKPLSCVNHSLNFSSVWYPHGNPFMSSSTAWAELGSLVPSAHAIDDIPSTGRTLVLLHHFLHLTTAHMTAVEGMHSAIKDALVRLVSRNPDVQIVIRGPHTAYEGWATHYTAGDMFADHIEDMLVDVYKELRDRVVYFRPVEMTIATENMEFHPGVQKQIHDSMLDFICKR